MDSLTTGRRRFEEKLHRFHADTPPGYQLHASSLTTSCIHAGEWGAYNQAMTVFSHTTALLLLRVFNDRLAQDGPDRFDRKISEKYARVPYAGTLLDAPDPKSVDRVRNLLGNLSQNLHIQVSPERKINRKGVICHTISGGQLASDVLQLENDLFVPCPEELVYQLCQSNAFIQSLKYAYELCGCYSLPASQSHRGNLIKVSPLTTPQSIQGLTEQKAGARGRRTTLEVARFTLPFSASPMETALVIAFVLPRRKGGYGLPFPQLNYPITYQGPTSKEERFFLDIYWPEYKLAVEYDSDEHHFGSLDEAYHDAGRRMQLQKMGIETLVMTKGQMQSLEALDCAVEVIKGKMGKRIRLYDPDYIENRKALLSKLLPGIYHR